MYQSIRVLDDRISAEEVELLAKKAGDEGALEGKAGEPKWRGGQTQLLLRVYSEGISLVSKLQSRG